MPRFTVIIAVLLALMVQGAASELPTVKLEPVIDGLDAPVFLTAPDDGSGRLFIGDQTGAILMLNRDGRPGHEPFLDLRAKMTPLLRVFDERGL